MVWGFSLTLLIIIFNPQKTKKVSFNLSTNQRKIPYICNNIADNYSNLKVFLPYVFQN